MWGLRLWPLHSQPAAAVVSVAAEIVVSAAAEAGQYL
jgi:hypothetical protein